MAGPGAVAGPLSEDRVLPAVRLVAPTGIDLALGRPAGRSPLYERKIEMMEQPDQPGVGVADHLALDVGSGDQWHVTALIRDHQKRRISRYENDADQLIISRPVSASTPARIRISPAGKMSPNPRDV